MTEPDGLEELVDCPNCGSSTPSENLNCIYCGERLPIPVGFLSSLIEGWRGRAGIVLALLVLIAFLLWIL